MKYVLNFTRKFWVAAIIMLLSASSGFAQSITMSTGNCVATANEFQFDAFITNSGAGDLRYNSSVIRLTHAAGILEAGTNTLVFSYVSGSDFPLVFPPNSNPAFTYNAGTRLFGVSTSTGIYMNGTCTAPLIASGETKKLGRFSLKNTAQNFVPGSDVGLVWSTTSIVNAYLACAAGTTAFNTVNGNRTLASPCSLLIPAACSSPTIDTNPTDQSSCTIGTAVFTGSFTGGAPAPTLIWQEQIGGTGPFADLTEVVPYSGTATNTLTITNPSLSLSTNRYRLKATNTCGDVFTTDALLTVNPNVTAGTVSGTSPLCIGSTATYTSNGTAGGTWSSGNTLIATVDLNTGLVTAVAQGTTTITYTVNSGCGSPTTADQSVTVQALDFANLQFPASGAICIGGSFTAYGQVYEPGVTEAAGQGAGITVELGYSTTNTDPATWTDWIPATFNVQVNNNDEYMATFGSAFPANTYYYTFRYSLNGCGYQYGGYSAPGGNFWDGTNFVSGALTVNANVTAGTVSGTSPLCITATATYTSSGTAGGSWSSSDPLVATVDPVTGLVTAVAPGTTDITYTISTGCGSPVSSFETLTVSPNANAGVVTGSATLCTGSVYTFSSTGDATGSWSSTNTLVATVNATTGIVTAIGAGTTDITYTVSTGCNAPVSAFSTLTITGTATLAAVPGGSIVCSNAAVQPAATQPSGTTYTDGSCNTIATILPSGLVPVAGTVSTCVTIEPVVEIYQTKPYAQRHYDIMPDVNAANATATITLYYTQDEFDAYNLARGIFPPMPTGPADATGIANLLITQFHGTGTNPGNYTGGIVDLINADDSKIIWSGAPLNRWEITFDVNGFSGFYLHTSLDNTPLPISLLSFSGRNSGNANLLEWVTSSEQNTSYFELQRSTNGIDFVKATTLTAAGNSNINKTYSYNDNVSGISSNVFYYRLKQVDINGQVRYSTIVKLRLSSKGFYVEATPNPFKNQLRVQIDAIQTENAIITLNNIDGKRIVQLNKNINKGSNAVLLENLSNLPAGVYLLSVVTDTEKKTLKVIKQ